LDVIEAALAIVDDLDDNIAINRSAALQTRRTRGIPGRGDGESRQ
jgi:hypothetical protein